MNVKKDSTSVIKNTRLIIPFVLVSFYLFFRQNLTGRTGLGSVIALSLTGISVIYLLWSRKVISKDGVPFIFLAFLFLFSVLFSSSITLQRIAEILFYLLFICGIHNCSFGFHPYSDDRLAYIIVSSLIAGIDPYDLSTLIPVKHNKNINSRAGNMILKAFLGLIIGSPIFILVFLLLSTDSAFGAMMDDLCSWIYDIDLDFVITAGSCILGAVLFTLFLLLQVKAASLKKTDPFYDSFWLDKVSTRIAFIPSETVLFAVLPLIALYLLFFASQWHYYTAAFYGSLPEGYSYAEYARSGFFELCTVSFINLCVLCFSKWLVKKENSKTAIHILTIILCICTLILIATAVSKLLLYINEYCLTPLRIYAMWGMTVLTIVFLLFFVKEFVPGLPLYSACTIAVLFMLLILIYADPLSIIANYNAERFITGQYSMIDLDLFHNIGDAGIPALIKVRDYFNSLSPSIQTELIKSGALDPEKLELAELDFKYPLDIPTPFKWMFLTMPYLSALNAIQ